ncbi:hypothetical protein M885DRAFT_459389 [Pelagophyceae sp. CCMP2097]|nr:hypothetical protein M885DRAFT_459389 [Pelagophyceae sp. CCMP2097]
MLWEAKDLQPAAGVDGKPLPMIQTSGIKVEDWRGEAMLVATRDIAAGEVVAYATGLEVKDSPSIFTVQCSETKHVQPEDTMIEKANHSCDPNCEALVDEDLAMFALRAREDLASGSVITFDYETTEWAMDAPFDCACGASTCRGKIQGFKFQTAAHQITQLPKAAAHIQRMFHAQNTAN